MAKAGEKPNTPTPQVWSKPVVVELHILTKELFAGAANLSDVPTGWIHTQNLDIPPLEAVEWLKAAVARLNASPLDSVRRVSDISRRLEHEMYEANHRGQCNAFWVAKSIENELIRKGWWPRTRSPRHR